MAVEKDIIVGITCIEHDRSAWIRDGFAHATKLRHRRAHTRGEWNHEPHATRQANAFASSGAFESIHVSWHRLARTFVIYLMEMHF